MAEEFTDPGEDRELTTVVLGFWYMIKMPFNIVI